MNSIRCAKCGLVNFATSPECKRCQSPLSAPAPAAASHGFTAPQTFAGSHTFGAKTSAALPSSTSQVAPSRSAAPQPQAGGELYYKPSGEVTVAGLAAGLLGGLAVGALLALVYAYLLVYVPLVYAHLLCTLGYAFGLGAAVGYFLKVGKMRSPAVGVFVAGVVALLSYYFCWAVWLAAVLGRANLEVSTFELFSQPSFLLDVITRVNETGVWSIGRGSKTPVSGGFLWFVWGVEALVVLVGPVVAAWAMVSSEPFCEPCNEWCVEDQGLVSLGVGADKEAVRRVFETKDFERLKAFGAKRGDAMDWYRLDLYHCKGCDRTNALTVKAEKQSFDKKGNPTVSSTAFVNHLLLSPAETEDLRRVSREITSEAAQPQPAPAYA
jgi:hypothetical protein